jgi:hypothetical protein
VFLALVICISSSGYCQVKSRNNQITFVQGIKVQQFFKTRRLLFLKPEQHQHNGKQKETTTLQYIQIHIKQTRKQEDEHKYHSNRKKHRERRQKS